jgi:arylsulfatase A-like enzyme
MSSEFNRRDFLSLGGAGLLSGVAGPVGAESPVMHQQVTSTFGGATNDRLKNLILFMPDEMRADSLACYGNPATKTPNLDKLAQEGARFDQCHVQYPVCGASRCAMLTGWPTSVRGHRSLYYFLRPEEPNLFRYLRQAGYDVFWFGKNDALASQSFHDSVTEWGESAVSPGTGAAPPRKLTPGSLSMLYSAGSSDRRQTGDYRLLQKAIAVLERTQQNRPFCIFLPLFEPHPPYTIPTDFYSMYSPSSLPELAPPGLKKKPDFHAGIRTRYGLDKLNDPTFRTIRAVYYGQVSYSDWLLGELMGSLEKTGHANDTALFVTSDHGDYAGDYGLVEKWPSGLEDCLTRVPMIGRVPGAKAGVVGTDMTEMYDVMQTFLDLAGTHANHTHFSRSLLPQMHGAPGDKDRAAFSEGGYNIYEPQCFEPLGAGGGPYEGKIHLQNEQPVMVSRSSMVRTKAHKLIVRPQGQSELYDSVKDSGEFNNLYGQRGSAEIQGELQQKLLTHYIQTTGIAPMDKDPREAPPFMPTKANLTSAGWQTAVLDGGAR